MQIEQELTKYLGFLSQDENNLSLLENIIALYLQLDNLSEAQKYLQRAQSINPDACLKMEGLLLLKQGNHAKANDCFAKALTFNNSPQLRYFLASSFYQESAFDEALAMLDPIMHYENHDILLLKARVLHHMQQPEKAIQALESNLALYPDHAESLGLMALLQYDQDDENMAKKYVKKSLKINPETYEALLVDTLLKSATGEASTTQIEKLLEIQPEDCRLLFALGNTWLLQHDIERARIAFQAALDIYPDFYECHLMQAWCYLMQDNLEEAQHYYIMAREAAPELSEGWAGLGLVAALNDDFIVAGHLIEKAQELNEDSYLSELAQAIFYLHNDPAKSKVHAENVLNDGMQLIHKKIEQAALFLESGTSFIH